MQDKLMAVYWAEPIADVVAVLFTTVLFAFQFKKALKSISAQNTSEERAQDALA